MLLAIRAGQISKTVPGATAVAGQNADRARGYPAKRWQRAKGLVKTYSRLAAPTIHLPLTAHTHGPFLACHCTLHAHSHLLLTHSPPALPLPLSCMHTDLGPEEYISAPLRACRSLAARRSAMACHATRHQLLLHSSHSAGPLHKPNTNISRWAAYHGQNTPLGLHSTRHRTALDK